MIANRRISKCFYQIKVSPVLAGPLSFSTLTMYCRDRPSNSRAEKTLQNIMIPQQKLDQYIANTFYLIKIST